MKKLLGAISPAYGALTGKGAMGKIAREGGMGLIPRMTSREAYDESEEEKRKREAQGMKKGGSVSASKRADGCAVKGKTKGRMV